VGARGLALVLRRGHRRARRLTAASAATRSTIKTGPKTGVRYDSPATAQGIGAPHPSVGSPSARPCQPPEGACLIHSL
jgi:hypothetical protein